VDDAGVRCDHARGRIRVAPPLRRGEIPRDKPIAGR
jgi:hypothetical protein